MKFLLTIIGSSMVITGLVAPIYTMAHTFYPYPVNDFAVKGLIYIGCVMAIMIGSSILSSILDS